MGNLWKKIAHIGVEPGTNDWNQRNLRMMNSMTFIMCCSMFMFAILSVTLTSGGGLYMISGVFVSCLIYFVVAKYARLFIAKIYFCILPVACVAMISIFAVGSPGNDVYYFLDTCVIPLVLFKQKKLYVPLILLSFVSFFGCLYAQKFVEPAVVITEEAMPVYFVTNIVMIFVFLLAMITLFKSEISGHQNNLNQQKQIVEEKNREITESITYASRIQEAILPVQEKFDRLLPQNYVWYQPKDIVAGDFYWLESSGDDVFLAAADCTGHGVPGAMVSVVCHNSLNRAVREFGLRSPAAILDKTRELVIETFSESNKNVKDGMDIALCRINLKSMSLTFAGANNSLYYIRNNQLFEIKPDKQPIGNFDRPKPFSEHSISLQKGDIIHIFTDGFADQFGGPKGKKFKYKTFKDLLVSVAERDIREQKNLIERKFLDWRGDFEQVDDVCVIGVRV